MPPPQLNFITATTNRVQTKVNQDHGTSTTSTNFKKRGFFILVSIIDDDEDGGNRKQKCTNNIAWSIGRKSDNILQIANAT